MQIFIRIVQGHLYIHWSATILKPLRGEVINTDDLFTMESVKGWNILDGKWTAILEVNVLEAGKMSMGKDLSHLDKGQIVKARRLGQKSP